MANEMNETLKEYENLPEDDTISEEIFDEEETVYETFKPVIPKITPKERSNLGGQREIADGRILTIKSYSFTKVKTKDKEGNKIEPNKTLTSGAKYYPGKLAIHFVEDNLVEYYPNLKYFVKDNGKVSKEVRINRDGSNAIAELAAKVITKIGKESDDISDAEIYDFLIGKKVKIETKKGNYKGKDWFRNDIAEFV